MKVDKPIDSWTLSKDGRNREVGSSRRSVLLHVCGLPCWYRMCFIPHRDGANMNALLGRVRPRDLGVDLLHLNLHKVYLLC